MKNYFRVMLGAKSAYAALCREQGFIGADYQIAQDLSADLFDNWRDFNQKYRPIFLDAHPEKTMIGAGLACGACDAAPRECQQVFFCQDASDLDPWRGGSRSLSWPRRPLPCGST